jgi:hypothetical protein
MSRSTSHYCVDAIRTCSIWRATRARTFLSLAPQGYFNTSYYTLWKRVVLLLQ